MMKENTIVQFVGFETTAEPNAFMLLWDEYISAFSPDVSVTLHQQAGLKGRFKFMSKHIWPVADFQFTFKKGRHLGFAEKEARVVQLGGYMPVHIECIRDTDAGDLKLMLFLNHGEAGIALLKKLKMYRYLNIYEAYYESCIYADILEFFVEESSLDDLISNIKTIVDHPQIATFKESLVLND